MYYPSSENKGADQLRSYCEADLRLCFRLGTLLVFPCGGSNVYVHSKTWVYRGYGVSYFSQNIDCNCGFSLLYLSFFFYTNSTIYGLNET